MNFAEMVKNTLHKEIFSEEDLKIFLKEKKASVIHSGISRSLKAKDFIKLKRGLYLLGKRLRQGQISKFFIASKMYTPTYISFESALSYHGLIPEAVYVTTSACPQRLKKLFKTPLGEFSYDYVPCRPFFLGVEHTSIQGGVLIANPLKALFDLIYLRKKKYSSLMEIESDLRIEREEIMPFVRQITVKELEELANSYGKRSIKKFLEVLVRETK
ncbi:MAG: hypothetical protein HQK50_18070 [Oligoflexia bacterium]|nr:hypothetical protein [Oligoflexia bacterium]MBF0367486.1 hypothetical protein [Oligoflexia bacterium]